MAENERHNNEKGEAKAAAATTMVGNDGGSLDDGQEENVTAATPAAVHAADVAVENSSPSAAAASAGGQDGSVLRPSNSDDAAAARMAELAAIAAVTGGDDDSTSSSSSSGGGGGEDADPWSADLTADGIPAPPAATSSAAAADTAAAAAAATGPGMFNRLSSLRTSISTTANSAKSSVLSNPTVKQAQGRSWRENAGALVGGGLAMAKDELTKTVGGGVSAAGGDNDDAADGDSSDNESSGSESSGSSDDDSSSSSSARDTDTGLGDEEDEYTSGAEGIMYSESQEAEAGGGAAAAAAKSVVAAAGIKSRLDDGDNTSPADNDNEERMMMTEMEIEEELPMAEATTTSAASARWFSARRTALDSVATGFRGRYNDKPSTEQPAAAASMDESSALAAAAAAAETGLVDAVRAMDLGIVSISPNNDDNKSSTASPSPLHSPLLLPSPKAPVTMGPATGKQPPADPQADQVQRILSFGPEMDALMSTLKPDQYPMLLGRGMLGVNLRQTYGQDQNGAGGLGSCGVYVDYVVPRGNADRSGVVRAGDRLVKVGEDSVVRGTIGDVPQRIAAMKRPGVLVLASGKELGDRSNKEDVCADGTLDWVDVSIGLINALAGDVQESQLIQPKLDEVEGEKAVSGEADGVDATPIPLQRDVSLLDAEDTGDEEDSNDAEPLADKEEATEEGKSHSGPHYESPYNLVPSVGVTTSSYPSASVCQELVNLATKRANPFGSISSGTINSLFEDLEMIEESVDDTGGDQKMGDDMKLAKRMKDAFHKALIHICLDPRSSPFLVAHMEFEDKKAVEARKQAVKEMGLPPSDVDEELDRRNSAAILLEYYLELLSYLVIIDATPAGRRTEIEIRLADSFRDLTTSNLLTDRDTLAEVKSTLDDMLVKGSAKKVDADFLAKLRIMTGKSIAVSPQFVTFLLGDQCARMRGYLHKTTPYVNVPLSPLVDGAISVRRSKTPSTNAAHAHNHLLFAMLHLICRYEIDEDCEEAKQGFPIPEKDRRRIAGSAGGLACALFIRGTMLPCIDEAEKSLAERDSDGADCEKQSKEEEQACYKSLISSCEQLWESYVAPAGGILDDIIFDDTERATCLVNDVRRALVAAISVGDRPKGVVEKATVGDDDRGLKVVRAVVSSTELKVSLSKLAEELVHDYAVAIQPEYRKHMFHEWVCGEVQRWAQKEAKSPPDYSGTGDALSKGIYLLSDGSITRLMRRVELPKGVSQHRPQRIASTSIVPPPKIKADNDTAGQPPHSPQRNINAEYAIVFGNDEGMDSTGRVLDPSLAVDFGAVRRFACVKLRGQADEPSLDEDDIPPTLENYAVVPPIRELPFADIIDEGRLSTDGWEVSLVNFMVPNANPGAAEATDDAEGSFIYGVSLVFNQIVDDDDDDVQADDNDNDEAPKYTTELEYVGPTSTFEKPTPPSKMDTDGSDSGFVTPSKGLNHQQVTFQSPITVSRSKNEDGGETSEVVRKIRVSAQTPEFNRRLREMRWSERVKKRKTSGGGGATVGIALVSGRNSIPAMRDTLSQLFDDYTNVGLNEEGTSADLVGDQAQRVCDLLVDILGTLSQINVEREALNCILEPYIDYGSSQWIPRPLSEQSREFASTSGLELIQSLPPIPLALLFLTILLEQKIVLSSRRRSVLVSATMALRSMMNPLTWAHLFVPLVPASMAGDLMHYPAPFILGVPSEDEDSMVLLNSLPADVTLVDLDVGRVILASRLSNEEGINGGMLRSQVLFLAETLGSVFGCKMQGPTWRCDSPLRRFSPIQGQALPPSAVGAGGTDHIKDGSEFAAIKQICKEFIVELLSGARSCCYWIEEKRPGRSSTDTHECSVLFDEDRFFSIKSLRSEGRYMPLLMGQQLFGSNTSSSDDLDEPIGRDTILALNPDDFDLVLEVFLRCQGMSTYISSRKKQSMAFH